MGKFGAWMGVGNEWKIYLGEMGAQHTDNEWMDGGLEIGRCTTYGMLVFLLGHGGLGF